MRRALSLAVVTAATGLLGGVPAAQADFRVGHNYRLNSDPSAFRGKDQVALAVDPGNPQHIVEVNANYLTENCEATTSVDGGVTWSEAFPLSPPPPGPGEQPFEPTCRVSNHLGESMFQTVSFGSGQNVYATSITPRFSATGGEQGASTLVYKSVDGGRTWGAGVVAMAGGPASATGPYYELPTLAVDPGAGAGGADRVISVAHETQGAGTSGPPCPVPTPPATPSCPSVRSAVSNDGGQSFAGTVIASPVGVAVGGPDSASQPVVGPDHSVSVAWRTSGTQGTVQIARSTDGAQTWGPAVSVTNVTAGGRPSSSHVTPQPSGGSTFPRLAVDRQNGRLYLVYNQGPPGPSAPAGGYQGADHFINPDSHVYFQRSLDHGATWSTPKLIDNTTPHPGSLTIQTRHPSVSVAPNGRVDIVWEDRRHWYQGPGEHNCVHTHLACDDARLGDTYYAYSADGGSNFSVDHRVSDRSHNNDVGFDYRFGTGWAFGPQAVAIGNDQVLIGWMDSREGSFDSDNQDIYLARVNLNAPSAVPQSNIDQSDPVALSVALSNFTYLGGGESLMAGTFATRSATKVVIANQGDLAGALAGSVLARANLGPVLLSPPSGLPANVKAEVSRLGPAGAYVVGDSGHLSDQVVQDLVSAGVPAGQIVRLGGPDNSGTAALIASQLDRRTDVEKAAGTPAFDAAVIANPASPDASAASALAAARRLPILYVSAGSIPAATAAALNALNINKTLVIGGAQWVSDALLGQLPSASRLGGADQYATSQAVVGESLARGLPSNVVYVADGARPMDAALLGAAVGRTTGTMLLARAPLYASAAGAASAFGLSGIDQFVVLGPAPPGQIIPGLPGGRPLITSASLSHKRFRVSRRATALAAARRRRRSPLGTTIRLRLSAAAKVSFVISQRLSGRRVGRRCVAPRRSLRRRRACARVLIKGTLTRNARAGANSVSFSGRIGRRALKPGLYRVTLTATNAGGRSRSVVRSFRIVIR